MKDVFGSECGCTASRPGESCARDCNCIACEQQARRDKISRCSNPRRISSRRHAAAHHAAGRSSADTPHFSQRRRILPSWTSETVFGVQDLDSQDSLHWPAGDMMVSAIGNTRGGLTGHGHNAEPIWAALPGPSSCRGDHRASLGRGATAVPGSVTEFDRWRGTHGRGALTSGAAGPTGMQERDLQANRQDCDFVFRDPRCFDIDGRCGTLGCNRAVNQWLPAVPGGTCELIRFENTCWCTCVPPPEPRLPPIKPWTPPRDCDSELRACLIRIKGWAQTASAGCAGTPRPMECRAAVMLAHGFLQMGCRAAYLACLFSG